jgi:nuclear pore complex protein Nup62
MLAVQYSIHSRKLMFSVCMQEVHDSLVSVEAEAERLFASERVLMDADTQDRDRLYSRAQAVSARALGQELLFAASAESSVCKHKYLDR